jgi:hypothetical protein
MPMRIAQPVNRSRIPRKNFEYSSSSVLRSLGRPPLRTLHCISDSIAPIVSSTADLAILNHPIACDRKIDVERLRNSEHESIANLPVADLFAVLLPACVWACRQPFTRRRIFVSQQRDKMRSSHRAT